MSELSEIRPFKRQKTHPPSESTATFIKDFLTKHGKGYSYGMWKAWADHLHRLGFKEPKIESFRKYLWILKKLGLIQKTKAPSYKIESRFLREYYELVRKQIGNEKAWSNPSAALDLRQGRTFMIHRPANPFHCQSSDVDAIERRFFICRQSLSVDQKQDS